MRGGGSRTSPTRPALRSSARCSRRSGRDRAFTLLEGVRASRLLTGPDGGVRGAVFGTSRRRTGRGHRRRPWCSRPAVSAACTRARRPRSVRAGADRHGGEGRRGTRRPRVRAVPSDRDAGRRRSAAAGERSGARRGGGVVDERGTPIMRGIDARGDLAPRDVVARGVADVEREGRFASWMPARWAPRSRSVFPDPRDRAARRNRCAHHAHSVTPAAHYTIGGIATDIDVVRRCRDCGPAARPRRRLHGANRLASNSLVEGLVFGAAWVAHSAERRA